MNRNNKWCHVGDVALHFFGSIVEDWAHCRWQRHAGGAECEAGCGAWCRANDEPFAFLLDLGLGQRVEIGDDVSPGHGPIECGDPIFQCLLQYEGEEAAEHMTANGLVELMEDRPGRQQMFCGPEGLLNRPKLLVAEHGVERVEVGIGAQHEDAIELRVALDLGLIDGEVVFAYRLEVAPVPGIAN